MKTILYIYLGTSVLAFILYVFTVLKVSHEFKRRYPNLKPSKNYLIDTVGSIFKAILRHFIPLVNALFLFIYLFRDEELEELTIERLYSKLSKEDTDDGDA